MVYEINLLGLSVSFLYRGLICILLLILSYQGQAQFDFKVNLSPGHKEKIEAAKNGKQKLRRYKRHLAKARKCAARKQRKLEQKVRKELKEISDSLDLKTRGWIPINKLEQYLSGDSTSIELDSNDIQSFFPQLLEDSLRGKLYSHFDAKSLPKDSADLKEVMVAKKEAVIDQFEKSSYYPSEFSGLYQFDSTGISIDTAGVKSAAENFAAEYMEDINGESLEDLDFEQYKTKLEGCYSEFPGLEADYLNEGFSKVDTSQSFNELLKAEAISLVSEQVEKLKKKYAKVPNSNDLSSAVKRKSLSDKPFYNRLYLGGHFSVLSTSPIVVDCKPQVGLYINKDFLIGTLAIFQQDFGYLEKENNKNVVKNNRSGYGAFLSYSFWRNFFLYAEYNRTRNASFFEASEGLIWQDQPLVGIGKALAIHPLLDSFILLLYDPTQRNSSHLLNLPLTIRFGINISEIGRSKLGIK